MISREEIESLKNSLARGEKVRIVKMDHPLGTLVRSMPNGPWKDLCDLALWALEAKRNLVNTQGRICSDICSNVRHAKECVAAIETLAKFPQQAQPTSPHYGGPR